MTTAIIGTGVLGSVIARLLASGGETVRLSGADQESTRKLAGDIGPAAVVAVDNGDAVQGADAVVLALRFAVLRSVVEELTHLARIRRLSLNCPASPPVLLVPTYGPSARRSA